MNTEVFYAVAIEDIFKLHDCRLENEHGEMFYLTIVDRSKYPRLWIDNFTDNEFTVIEESTNHLLARNNPMLEKDWIIRFEGVDFHSLVKQYNEWRLLCDKESGAYNESKQKGYYSPITKIWKPLN